MAYLLSVGVALTPANLKAADGGNGFDHNWCVKSENSAAKIPMAKVVSTKTGRVLELSGTQPGVQFYTGNFLKGQTGKGGVAYKKQSAFCLETQHFPDSPNRPEFPSALLRPGEVYNHTAEFTFSVL